MQEKKAKADEQRALLQELKGKETVTKSGQKVNLYSNIGSIQDVDAGQFQKLDYSPQSPSKK